MGQEGYIMDENSQMKSSAVHHFEDESGSQERFQIHKNSFRIFLDLD